jgi:NADH dehydrogenase
VLAPFAEPLREAARHSLEKLGVEVRTGSVVTGVDDDGVAIGGERISAGTVLWAAGVAASPIAQSLGVPLDRAGRVTPETTLALAAFPNIFIVGDLCLFVQDGKPLAGVAQVAMQQGTRAGQNVRRAAAGQPLEAFRYKDYGIMATIGRGAAVGDILGLRISGFFAWIFWIFLHIFWLIGFRNRFVVMTEWAWAYFSLQRRVRLITGEKIT